MTELPDYLIKLSVGLAVAYIFYFAVLRKLTFYTWNRWYLLLYSMLAFFIPFIDVGRLVPKEKLTYQEIDTRLPRLDNFLSQIYEEAALPSSPAPEEPVNWLLIVLVTGIVVMTGRLCLNFYFYTRIKREAHLVSEDDIKLYHVDREIFPFSFGNAVFINPTLHSDDDLEKIILHEYVHVQQKHTFDNIWAEIICILNWYNPFAWLIRYSIRQNLEYIADDQVLRHNVDVKKYQYLLLKVTGVPEYRLTSQFNFPSLKQRIMMMNKARTPKIYLIRFLFLAPLIIALLVAFRPDLDRLQMISGNHAVMHRGGKSKPRLTQPKDSYAYCAGVILDAATRKPIGDAQLELVAGGSVVKILRTDRDGYFYSDLKAAPVSGKHLLYSISLLHPEHPDLVSEFHAGDFNSGYGRVSVRFLSAKKDSTIRGYYYAPKHQKFHNTTDSEQVNKNVKEYLTSLLPNYQAEIQLIADFKKYHPFPKNVLIKFKNGYFDRSKELVGYEGVTELYLDGQKATYEEINEAFRSSPFLLSDTRLSKEWGDDRTYAKLKFLTFPLYKDPPPAHLLAGNVEVKNLSAFDISVLDKEAYFLDGFRQVFGVGSNIKPPKSEIKRVVLFKGRLARYYDPKLEKVWWIETRPENEVFGRPDLAQK
ncbi:M56 family metallopeptidase [Dyadobacter psychrophilus]|uniref:Signal transducer regulating beta-lactamase production, contains metallopeptidase domain n=1 Tax=Dyadobacter psychrophilus TaxID=651661 RepID=A0A1T5GAD3_9BACT|nr:M56 family metallopeptidase [Dyadobacter psychrophilus]SKC05349.1 Signal transducer regulating beta-lactamase production, contains metallopeptidase domain [Dyadobacter psychrophilus]